MEYVQDYYIAAEIVALVLLSLVSVYQLDVSKERAAQLRRITIKALCAGVAILLLGVSGNSVAASRWDIQFVMAFLLGKKTGTWFFRFMVPLSYVCLVMGAGVGIRLWKLSRGRGEEL